MTRPVISAKRNTPIRDIALQLMSGSYSGMPITDEKGNILGIVTELDILDWVNSGGEMLRTLAGDIMKTEVVTAPPEMTLTDLIGLMKKHNIIRVPIAKNRKLVGIVSRSDILRHLIEPEFVTNL